MTTCHFPAKMVHLPQMRIFSENPLVNLVVFTHVYLHAKKQSQMSIYERDIDN